MKKKKILANDGMSKAGVEILENAGFEVITQTVPQDGLAEYINANGIDALVVRSATKVRKDLIDACRDLKLIGRAGVGMDNIDVAYARSIGRTVVNTPNASSVSVAELALGHMISVARSLNDSNRQMPLEGESNFAGLKKKYAKGKELHGKTLGVIGFGRIGQQLAKAAIGLGMKVVFTDSFITEPVTLNLKFFDGQRLSFTITPSSMKEVLAEADFISLHVPAQEKPIIDEAAIAAMKDGVIIINAARGGVVDEEALLKGIESGKVAGAGLDVFKNEPTPPVALLMHEQISLTPHIGASTTDAQDKIGTEMAQNIIEAFKNM